MPDQMMNMSCRDFADALSAKQSVPGGGGAAAYVGALAVALCSMTGNFTVGKERYADVEEDVQQILAKAEQVRKRLLDLVEEDATAFAPLAKAYGIAKDDPNRESALKEATLKACEAPLEMMRQICISIELLQEMLEKGSRMLISDVGCGALLAASALKAASLNIIINTRSLTGCNEAIAIEAQCDEMLADYVLRAKKVSDVVLSEIQAG